MNALCWRISDIFLEQIAQLAIERKVDGVLLAGDLYDKPVPPAEAVILLDTFFYGALSGRNPRLCHQRESRLSRAVEFWRASF